LRREFAALYVAGLLLPSQLSLTQETAQHSYDALGRLTGSIYTGGPRAGKQSDLAYDPAGNRTAQAYGVGLPGANNAVSFSVSGPGTLQEGQLAVFTITKNAPARDPLSVNFATVAGSAVSPGDYTAVSGTLSFLGWETAKTVSVQVINDGVSEGTEQFSLQLSSPTAPSSVAVGSATVTIASSGPANQPPTAVFDSITMGQCTDVTFRPAQNDTDPEGNYPLYLNSVGQNSFVQTSFNSNEANPLVYFTSGGATGTWSLSYSVRDSLGASSNGTISVRVTSNGGCN
jgi:YD repeat-containing protein